MELGLELHKAVRLRSAHIQLSIKLLKLIRNYFTHQIYNYLIVYIIVQLTQDLLYAFVYIQPSDATACYT